MAATPKRISDWGRIFLDTSIICSLFLAEKPETTDQTVLFVKKLIGYLSSSKTGTSENRIFFVSTISLSEILTRENDAEKIKRILRVLYNSSVEFIDFNLQTALSFNAQLYHHLSRTKLNERAKSLGFATNDYMMAREWITRDYMIVMSGVKRNVDVILTCDKKTFYPLAKDANAYCCLAYPVLFEHSDQYILQYYDGQVENFLNYEPQIRGEESIKIEPGEETIGIQEV